MRVLLWSSTFWPHIGGVEVLGANFAPALHDRGHEVVVLARRDTPDLPPRSQVAGIPVVRHPFRQALEARDIESVAASRSAVVELIRGFRPQVLHLYHLGPDVVFRRMTRTVESVPTVVTLHQAFTGDLLAGDVAVGRTLGEANWIAACSTDVLEDIRARVPGSASSSSVIPNALPPPPLSPGPLPQDPPVVLMVGRIVPQKGFDLGLEAVARTARGHRRALVVIAGDGIGRHELERKALDLGLDKAVEMLGWVRPEAVPALINRATIVLVPSRYEPFGLVALQAAQMGRPVAGFRVGGLPEVVKHDRTGLLVEPEDVSALAEALRRLLDEPYEASSFGQAAYSAARGGSAWEAHVSAYEAVYEQVTAGSREDPGGRG